MTGQPGNFGPIVEPLEDLAWFAFENADALCDPAAGCRDYHRFWSMVRLIDLGGRPPRGAAFFGQWLFRAGDQRRAPRVLIAGAADAGLAAMIAGVARAGGLEPALVVIDRCRTPLAQNAMLARKLGLDIETRQGGIADLTVGGFDAAITHNVMGFNTDAERGAMLHAIGRALRPGGRLLSIEHLSEHRVERDPGQAAPLRAAFMERLRSRGMGEAECRRLGDAAEAYWSLDVRVGPYPEERLRVHLQDAGLRLRSLTCHGDPQVASPRSRPGEAGARKHAYIVAEREG